MNPERPRTTETQRKRRVLIIEPGLNGVTGQRITYRIYTQTESRNGVDFSELDKKFPFGFFSGALRLLDKTFEN